MDENSLDKGVKVFRLIKLKAYDLFLSTGSVLDFEGDAIVNAANEGGLDGGGIDGAINSFGGKELYEARKNMVAAVSKGPGIPTGQAKITIPDATNKEARFGRLKARSVIHAVGPMFFSKYAEDPDTLLKNAYKSCLEIVENNEEAEINSLGFCLLSAGIFKGRKPLTEVLALGLSAIQEFDDVQENREERKELFVIAFTPSEGKALKEAGELVFQREKIEKVEKNKVAEELSLEEKSEIKSEDKPKEEEETDDPKL
eukprot:maker-scaffold_49-snap-gene-1.90-mRNA-1 protein AED:0.30 eAED:0.30 QI:99/1/1/1/1/1/2/71/256